MLLALRLREMMDENLQQEKKYRDIFQHSEHLSMQVNAMTYHMIPSMEARVSAKGYP